MLENIQRNISLDEYSLILLILSILTLMIVPIFPKPKLVKAIVIPIICLTTGFSVSNFFKFNSLKGDTSIINSCYKVTHKDTSNRLENQLNKLQKQKAELLSQLKIAEQYNAQNISEFTDAIYVNKQREKELEKEIEKTNFSEIKIIGLSNRRHIILTNNNNVITYDMIDFLFNYHLEEKTCSKSITMLNKSYQESL